MNGFTKFSKGLCIFSMVCCCILSFVFASMFGRDYESWNDQPINAGKYLLILLMGFLVTAVIHSFWGMLISIAENINDIRLNTGSMMTDIYRIMNDTNNSASEKSSGTTAVDSGEYQSTANRYANESSAALQRLQNINGDSPNANSISPVDLLKKESVVETARTAPPVSAAKTETTQVAQTQVPATPWTCRNCGENNPGDAKFCGHCGLFR